MNAEEELAADLRQDGGPPVETPPAAASKGRVWLRWAFRVMTVALAVWVLWSVSWHDSLTLSDGSMRTGEFVGEVPRGPAGEATITIKDASGADTYKTNELKLTDIEGELYPKMDIGVIRIVREADKSRLLLGFLIFGLVSQFGVWRWWILLRAMKIRLSFWAAHKLTFIGFFFNNVVPGATGGDVVKAVYVARGTDHRAAAVMTVVLDRLLGLFALALIAVIVLLIQHDRPEFDQVRLPVYLFLAAGTVFTFVFFSTRVRTILRVESWLPRLPGGALLQKADAALVAWRDHVGTMVWAVVLSFGNQLGIQVMMWTLAAGLHVTTRDGGAVSPFDYMVALPVAFIASAIPAMPGGWGVRELAFAVCLHFVGVERGPAVALSVMAGLVQLLWSVPGGVYFVMGRAGGEFKPGPALPPGASPSPAKAVPPGG